MIPSEIIPQLKSGARVRIASLGGEGTSTFEGLVISRKHGKEAGGTFTVRAVVAGVGVEKIFPIHSPAITKIKILSSPKKVHRAKLYWVRGSSGSKIRQRLGVSL